MIVENNTLQADLVIVGGGLVGASLAVALRDSSLKIVIIEPYPADHEAQPSYNERTVALTWSARQIYSGMGIWSCIANHEIEPIADIHVSTRGQYGMTHLSADDVGTEALGYVVPTRHLGTVLYETLADASGITLLDGASAEDIVNEEEHCKVSVKQNGDTFSVHSPLVVLADGGRSALGAKFNVEEKPYSQSALLTFVTADQPHNGRAYERFTSEGPLALLPHTKNRYAVVWTCEPENLQRRLEMNDLDFLAALQDTFGDRAGTFSRPAPRKHYPLNRLQLNHPVNGRCVVIGNAAHTVHPVAGQGFNLGLRDVAALAETIASSCSSGSDIGGDASLSQYALSRKHDTLMVHRFTHGLIALFSHETLPSKLARSALLQGVECLPVAKRFLLRRTMGLTTKSSRLAMGLPLSFSGKTQSSGGNL